MSSNEELVSIIVPIYNVEKYLSDCLDSLTNQTYKNIEIVLVNDGSKDNSVEICKEYQKKDKNRIKVINQENRGLSAARNRGIEEASGHYLLFVDSDDWIDLSLVEKLYNVVKNNNAQMACCGLYFAKDSMNIVREMKVKQNLFLSKEEALEKVLYTKDLGTAAWAKLYEKKLFDEIKFPVGEIHEDVPVIPRIMEKCSKICIVAEALYYYRVNNEGISKNKSYSDKYDVVLNHVLENEQYFTSRYPELITVTRATVGRSSADMMRKILNTKNGFITYKDIFEKYRTELIRTKKYYIEFGHINIKQRLLVFLYCNTNRFTYKVLRTFKYYS